jgi:hypothetical protein
MFGGKRRAEKKAAEEAARAERTRSELRDTIIKLIAQAEGQEATYPDWPLVLKPGERLVSTLENIGLFEPRRGPGHWKGRSAGVSVPVPDTRLRVRVGKSAGTYIQGAETPTVIDTGNGSITTERIVFQGDKYTREWDYSKLIGLVHYSDKPATAIQVSNREKTSGVLYAGVDSTEPVRLAMTVAIAIFHGETDDTIKELRDELAKLDAEAKPAAMRSGAPAAAVAPGASNQGGPDAAKREPLHDYPPPGVTRPDQETALPHPMWARDPTGEHQVRWWSGTEWTDYVGDQGKQSRDPLPSKN